MNKFKIGNPKQKLVLTDTKDRVKIKRESEDSINIPFMISSLKNQQNVSQDPLQSKNKISSRDRRSNSSLVDHRSSFDGLQNDPFAAITKKRVRAPSRFRQFRTRVERTQSATAGSQLESACINGSLIGLVGSLVEKLKDINPITVVNSGKGYSINKQQLKELMHYIIIKITAHTQLETHRSPFSNLDYSLQAIRLSQLNDVPLVKMDSNAFSHLTPIFEENKDAMSLKQVMEGLEERNRELSDRLSARRKELRMVELQRLNLEEITMELQEFHKYLKRQVEETQKEYDLKRQSNRHMERIIHQDYKNRLLFMASCEYKNIEQQTYNYALELQDTHLAADLSFEPPLFAEIEQLIMEEMKALGRSLMERTEWTVQEKSIKMRDFLVSSLRDLKNKDEDMRRINDFKTKCIRNYIHQMKRWYENWSLKKEYLSILRQQFMVDAKIINEQLTRLRDQAINSSSLYVDYAAMMAAFKSIEENFQIGNSFY